MAMPVPVAVVPVVVNPVVVVCPVLPVFTVLIAEILATLLPIATDFVAAGESVLEVAAAHVAIGDSITGTRAVCDSCPFGKAGSVTHARKLGRPAVSTRSFRRQRRGPIARSALRR